MKSKPSSTPTGMHVGGGHCSLLLALHGLAITLLRRVLKTIMSVPTEAIEAIMMEQ